MMKICHLIYFQKSGNAMGALNPAANGIPFDLMVGCGTLGAFCCVLLFCDTDTARCLSCGP